jgi:hypothetical protein
MARKASSKTSTSRPAPRAPSRRRRPAGVTLAEVRELALALPEAHERPSYGTPGFRVRDKLFARMLEDGESLAVKVTFDQREVMVASAPETFVVTPHYQAYPMVVVRLGHIDRGLLREVLEEAWRQAAPRSLLAGPKAR